MGMASDAMHSLTKGEHLIYRGQVSAGSRIPLLALGLILLTFYGVGLLF
jgi:hypothetical protein